jgi:hypothetical protein
MSIRISIIIRISPLIRPNSIVGVMNFLSGAMQVSIQIRQAAIIATIASIASTATAT